MAPLCVQLYEQIPAILLTPVFSICHSVVNFAEKYGFKAPSRMHVFRLVQKLKEKYTLLDVRKGEKGRSKTATHARNIRQVERCLDRAATREPGKQGPTARRNPLGLTQVEFQSHHKAICLFQGQQKSQKEFIFHPKQGRV